MKYPLSVIIALMAAVFVSCNDEEQRLLPVPGDYFPMQKDHRWEYIQTETYDHIDNQNDIFLKDTLHLQLTSRASYVDFTMTGTNNLDDSVNFPLAIVSDSDYHYSTLVLKSQHEYSLLPPYYSELQLFLVDDKPAGYSWKARGLNYSVIEVNGRKTVNDVTYTNVIQIRDEMSWIDPNTNTTESVETRHYYAKGVGEIYSSLKGTYSGYTHTVEFTLMLHTKL